MTKDEFKKDFAVFILSHGRAQSISTVEMLQRGKYTGDWYVVIDDEDDQADIYYAKFGEHVIMFNKKEEAERTDTGDTDNDRRVGVFARNAIQRLAAERGYKYHLQLDDDFRRLKYKTIEGGKLKGYEVKNIDGVLFAVANFLAETQITNLSFGILSDYMGGASSSKYAAQLTPKCMGSFMLKADDEIKFRMRMNDDITTTVMYEAIGKLMYTVMYILVDTCATQTQKGGMTEAYKDNGTYRKSFYSVMCCPSFVKIAKQGVKYYRIHHNILWGNCNPKLISEKWKKQDV